MIEPKRSKFFVLIWMFPTIVTAAIAFTAILHTPENPSYRVMVAGFVAMIVFLNGVIGRIVSANDACS